MFAKMAFQLQLFSMPLILFAIIPFKPLFKVMTHDQTALAMALSSCIGFLICLSKKNKIKAIITAMTLMINFLFLFNILYSYPTLGVLALILFLFGTSHFLNRLNEEIRPTEISWTNLLVSFLLFILPIFIIPKNTSSHATLFQYSMVLSGLTFVFININYIFKSNKLIAIALATASLIGLILFIDHQFLSLEFMFTVLLILNIIIFGYVSFRPKSIEAIEKQYDNFFAKPEITVIGYFLILALIGAFILQLDVSHSNSGTKHLFLDSFFTTISAVCVTGLAVFDTPVDFSFFGQGVILILIQLGGLGITTLSAWILFMLSTGRLSYSHEDTLYGSSGSDVNMDVKSFLIKIASYFFIVEFIGAFFLFLGFLSYFDSWRMALWHAIFTSVSAFCNAGFALQSDNLIKFNENPFILITVSLLIILGGFAPLMALDLPQKFLTKKLSIQDKLALVTTGFLLFVGFLFYLGVEWSHSLNDLTFVHKLSNSWFQSVTTRTAGFNSVDLTETRTITQVLMMMLMFIGGNPGSTAGGIKTLTFAVLAVVTLNALKENNKADVFGRWIPYKTIFRAVMIFFVSVLVHFIAYFFVSLTQQNIDPISLLFEVVSALGTVGLSTGATLKLDEIGKLVIIFCMLIGRVGPLTFILLFLNQNSKQRWKTPEEDVIIT